MKKIALKFFVAVLAFFAFASFATLPLVAREQPIRIRTADGFMVIPHNEQPPIIVGEHILVPIRAVMEELGFYVSWNRQIQTVSFEKPGYSALVQIGSYDMLINGNIAQLYIPAQIMASRTMIPASTVSDVFGMEVRWCYITRVIDIIEPITINYWPEHLPRYIPGSIILHPELHFESLIGAMYPMRFRAAFYYVCGEFMDLVGFDEASAFLQTVGNESFEVMTLMRFVQHFNISREEFEAVVERLSAFHILRGLDSNDEWYELPNADIIFTFDNDIIRYFYRRE